MFPAYRIGLPRRLEGREKAGKMLLLGALRALAVDRLGMPVIRSLYVGGMTPKSMSLLAN